MKSKEKVFETIARIPFGKVTTYGRVAQITKLHPRAVGIYLHQNTNPEKIPCHRVVNFQGKLAAGYAFGGAIGQARRLKSEGIKIKEDQVDLEKFLWKRTESGVGP